MTSTSDMPAYLAALRKRAEETPFATAVVTGERVMSWQRLSTQVERQAGALYRRLSASHGDNLSGVVVAIQLVHPVAHFVASLSLLRIGCAQVSLPSEASTEVTRSTIERTGAVLLIRGEVSPDFDVDQFSWHPVREPAGQLPESIDPNAPAILVVGSGTTGKRKLIPHTFGNLNHLVARDATTQAIETTDRHLCLSPIPFFTSKRRMLACLLVGATAVFRESDRMGLIPFCHTLDVSILSLVIPHATALVAELKKRSPAAPHLPNLKSIFIGSAPVGEPLRADLRRYVNPNLHVFYGPNEFGPALCAPPALLDEHEGTIGLPSDGVEVEVVDGDAHALPPGEIGELRFRAAGMFEGYVDDPEESGRALRNGWYYPGDLASLCENGAVIFKGRSDDLIIFNGINIYPREIENLLEQHPSVTEAAAFGFLAPDGTQLPGCAVVATPSFNHEEVGGYLKAHFGACRPRYLKVFEELPRNAAGKVSKTELRAAAEAHFGEQGRKAKS